MFQINGYDYTYTDTPDKSKHNKPEILMLIAVQMQLNE